MRTPHKLRFGLILLLPLWPFALLRAAEDTLLPIPDPAAITKAEKLIADIYKPYPPTKPADQKALALKLLDQAKETATDPAARYVLLRDAAKFAATNADLDTALLAIAETTRVYQSDAAALKADALRKAAATITQPAPALELLMPLLKLSDQAMKEGNYALSLEAATAADKSCRIANDVPMTTLVREQVAEAGLVQTAFQTAKPSLEKLATTPEDPDANLAAGKFLCYVRNQWDLGLPMLAKGSDTAIKSLVALDKAAGNEAEAKTKVADAWWEIGQSQNGIAKRGILRRAAYWYDQSLPTLTGLTRPLAQKRFDEASAGGRQGMAKAVDLLSLIQPASDTVSGKWEMQSGAVKSDGAGITRIEPPYEPPAEYDFRIEFTRTRGNDCVLQTVSSHETSFSWAMGAFHDTVFGFHLVGGKDCGNNPTTVRAKICLDLNRRYTSFVQVRKDVIRAYVNGKLISELKTNFSDLSAEGNWRLRNAKGIAFGCQDTPTIFHSIVVFEVTGTGKLTR